MATLLGLDVSHFQQGINWSQVKASGRSFVVLKATEGVGYVDPSFAGYRKAAHAAGLIVGIYHFARDNSPAAEAAYFAGVVGALQPNEFLVLDQEVPHASGNVPWCATWLDATRAHYGIAPFIYMNKGSSTGIASGNWTQVAQTYGLWAAIYDNSTTQPTVPYWGSAAMKQYSDAGTVLGVAGTCDVDVFYGTADQLLAYCTPGGTDVALTNADIGLLLNYPAYSGGPSVSQVLKNLDLAVADLHMWARGDLGRPTDSLSFIAGLITQLQTQVAAAPGMTCQGNPQAVLTALGEKFATPATPA